MISWSTVLRHSQQMFQPSGKGSIWILTTRVQATCNLESIVMTAMQLSFKSHYLRHYNSKAIVQRLWDPKRTKWTDSRLLAMTKMKNKKMAILRVDATCTCTWPPPNKLTKWMKVHQSRWGELNLLTHWLSFEPSKCMLLKSAVKGLAIAVQRI